WPVPVSASRLKTLRRFFLGCVRPVGLVGLGQNEPRAFSVALSGVMANFGAMPAPENFWNDLFAVRENAGLGVQVEMRCVSRHGRPFLLLPRSARCGPAALSLYP